MDNAQKAIIIGVSLFITIAVISGVLLVTNIGTDMMGNSNSQLEGVSKTVASQILADYNGVSLTGASVIAAIKKFYDKPNFILAVDNSTSGIGTYNQDAWYATKKKSGSSKLEASTDGKKFDSSGPSTYNKSKNYSCVLIQKNASIVDNTPDITGISSKAASAGGISSTANYKSYIIYLEGTDTIMGLYFKKII